MEKKKVLFIFPEITPYLPESEKSIIGRHLPQGIQERGKEIRTFMPRYGSVNERRNQLHEVIRLSGMNLVINDTDHPLIIKVASIQAARMQVYFIDNEDYFHRKHVLKDKDGKSFKDNDERAIFFSRGVLETVIKLRWAPDLVHCHGWFGALSPLLIKKTFADDPLFTNSKVIYSIYNDDFSNNLDTTMVDKLLSEDIAESDIELIKEPSYINLNKLAIAYADGIIIGSETINDEIKAAVLASGKPVLEYQTEETYIDAYNEFYDQILKD
ncbi:MAG: glycogen/starch synthase [Prolixibacteraceae bacterium]